MRDQAPLANAQANLSRYLPLLKPGFASDQQVADQRAAVNEMTAAVAQDGAAIFNAQTQLGYTTNTSPIDGVAGITGFTIGDTIDLAGFDALSRTDLAPENVLGLSV